MSHEHEVMDGRHLKTSDKHPHGGHGDHMAMINDFKKRFWISLFLTIPILLLSHVIQ